MRFISIFIGLTFMVGCSTVSPTCDVPRAKGSDATTIVIYRSSALVGILYSAPMSIDSCRVDNVKNDTYVVYKLAPGLHRIAIERRNLEMGGGTNLIKEFKSGKTYYMRQIVKFNTGIFLSLVSEEEALAEMPILLGISK